MLAPDILTHNFDAFSAPHIKRYARAGEGRLSSGGLIWHCAVAQIPVLAPVQETLRWQASRSPPARNMGGNPAKARKQAL